MPYQIAGIDVHKKILAVVVADVDVDDDYRFTRIQGGDKPRHDWERFSTLAHPLSIMMTSSQCYPMANGVQSGYGFPESAA